MTRFEPYLVLLNFLALLGLHLAALDALEEARSAQVVDLEVERRKRRGVVIRFPEPPAAA